jgi:dihydrofolate synthase / folylpolyglutamate synthase
MEFIPVKTRILLPPQDDLLAVLNKSLPPLSEGDIVVVSSKVVAISEGNCVPLEVVEKSVLVEQESELSIPRPYWGTPLTVKHSAFIGTAGIDESNAKGHYVLLPKDPFASALNIYTHLAQRRSLKNFGVVIVDSHSTPLRRGATGISIGWWGFEPIINHVGEEDLFGRPLKIEVTNLVDGIAAGANVVMGETNECQPVVIVRGTPRLTYTTEHTRDMMMVGFEDDTFRVLYERFRS